MGKKYIDANKVADELSKVPWYKREDEKQAIRIVKEFPSADVVEVVRCADCKYQDKGENDCEAWNLCGYRPWLHIPTEDDTFCSKGERKDG